MKLDKEELDILDVYEKGPRNRDALEGRDCGH